MRPALTVGEHHRPPVPDWVTVQSTADLLAGKWVAAVVVALSDGPLRRADLRRAIGHGISDKALTLTLTRMRARRLVTGRRTEDGPVKAYYRLTPRGRSLLDPMAALADWGGANSD